MCLRGTACVTLESVKTSFIDTHSSIVCWEIVGVHFFGPPFKRWFSWTEYVASVKNSTREDTVLENMVVTRWKKRLAEVYNKNFRLSIEMSSEPNDCLLASSRC